jgi:hypothetical protein
VYEELGLKRSDEDSTDSSNTYRFQLTQLWNYITLDGGCGAGGRFFVRCNPMKILLDTAKRVVSLDQLRWRQWFSVIVVYIMRGININIRLLQYRFIPTSLLRETSEQYTLAKTLILLLNLSHISRVCL